MASWVNQQVLRFDVSVDYSFSVDVGQTSYQLVSVQLKQKRMNWLVQANEDLVYSKDSHGDEVHHNVKHTLLWSLPRSKKGMLHFDDIRMVHLF